MTTARSQNRDWWLAGTALAIVFAIANRRLLTGRAAPIWDADSAFAPYQILIADCARSGRLLVWDPWLNAGTPDFANPETGALSPMTILVGGLGGPSLYGYTIYWLAIWLLAGIGMLCVARHLHAPPWGGLVVALGFVFSGFFTGHAEHLSHVHALAWLPVIVWRLDAGLLTGRVRPMVEAGALWGLGGLAGYPGLTILTGLFVGLWAGGRWLTATSARLPTFRTLLASLGAFLATGIAVLAPVYLGFLVEAQGFSSRVEPLPRAVVVADNALHPQALATFSSPYLATLWLESRDVLWPGTDVSSASVYIGGLVLWLAMVAVMLRPADRWRLWILALGAFFLAAALGPTLPVRGWVHDLVPPTRYFRHSAIFRDYTMFAVAVLALIGSRDLALGHTGISRLRARVLAAGACALAGSACAAYGFVTAVALEPGPHAGLALAHIALVWGGVVGLSIMWAVIRTVAWLPLALVTLATTDALLTERLSRRIAYTDRPEALAEWHRLDNAHVDSLDLQRWKLPRVPVASPGGTLTNKNLITKVPVLESYAPFLNSFHLRWVREPSLVESATGRARFWFAPRVATGPYSLEAFDAFSAHSREAGLLFVVHPPSVAVTQSNDAVPAIEPVPGATGRLDDAVAERIPARIVDYRPERLALSVAAPSEGWLLVTDRWARGWQAEVNGQRARVWIGNYIFRAVRVRAGSNDIVFTYHPFGMPWLLAVSWGTLLFVAVRAVRYRCDVVRSQSDRGPITGRSS